MNGDIKNSPVFAGVRKLLAAYKRGQTISLQTVCQVCEDMSVIPMNSLTQVERVYHGRYLKEVQFLRDEILDNLHRTIPDILGESRMAEKI